MEQQGSVKLGGSSVPAPSQVCWKVEQQRSVGRSIMVLDCRRLAGRSDLSSLHALQAGLVRLRSVPGKSGLAPCLAGAPIGLSGRRSYDASISHPLSMVQSQLVSFITAISVRRQIDRSQAYRRSRLSGLSGPALGVLEVLMQVEQTCWMLRCAVVGHRGRRLSL